MGDRAGSGVLQDCVLRSTDASAFERGMAKGRALVLGGSRGHSERQCCNRSLTGHLVGNRRAKTRSGNG